MSHSCLNNQLYFLEVVISKVSQFWSLLLMKIDDMYVYSVTNIKSCQVMLVLTHYMEPNLNLSNYVK